MGPQKNEAPRSCVATETVGRFSGTRNISGNVWEWHTFPEEWLRAAGKALRPRGICPLNSLNIQRGGCRITKNMFQHFYSIDTVWRGHSG